METTILLQKVPFSYNKEEKKFTFSEKHIPFATAYTVINEKTGKGRIFEFSHSTGSEYDPETRWVYKSETSQDSFTLEVCNDEVMCKQAEKAYLEHKLRK